MAIQEFYNISCGQDVPLERALGCFDMFVLHARDGDFSDVCLRCIAQEQFQ